MILSIDVGTSTLKGALIDETGRSLGTAYVRLLRKGWGVLPRWRASYWISAFEKLVERLVSDTAESAGTRTIKAIGVTGNGPTLVPLNQSGQVIFDVLHWADERVVHAPGIKRSFYLPRILWLKENRPDVWDRVSLFLGCPEYIAYWLTGEAWTVLPSAAFMPSIWSDEELAAGGVEKSRLPPFIEPGRSLGAVRPSVARRLGLPEGIPVFCGGSDFQMALVGTDTFASGRVCDRAGTSEGLNAFCDASLGAARALADPRLRVLPHLKPGTWNVSAMLSRSGTVFEWFRNITRQQRKDYQRMFREILKSPTFFEDAARSDRRPVFFFPNVHGEPDWTFLGGGVFSGLGPGVTDASMGRALVEAIGFAVRRGIEAIESTGLSVAELRVAGGQAKNPVWNKMKADITGKPVLVPGIEDAELLGNAAVALLGLGHYPDLEGAARGLVRIKQTWDPDPAEHRRYTDLHGEYRTAYAKLRQAMM